MARIVGDTQAHLSSADEIQNRLSRLADAEVAAQLSRFFKTAPGQYGEGERFRGIKVPQLRKLSKSVSSLMSLGEMEHLLGSSWHEDRYLALLLMIDRFESGSGPKKHEVFTSYMTNIRFVNNWDLVDLSAPSIPGPYLLNRPRKVLFTLAESPVMWNRRIALLSTFHFIRNNDFTDTVALIGNYLDDSEDLIQKASGWMLREIGKRNLSLLERFLEKWYLKMPRTMLRYAIEKLPEKRRQDYLRGTV